MCYGPVVPNGYGVCYNPHPEYMLCAITSFKDCGETRSDFFAYTLEGCFKQMHQLCLKVGNKLASNGAVNGSTKSSVPPAHSPKRTKLVRQEETRVDGVAANGSGGS